MLSIAAKSQLDLKYNAGTEKRTVKPSVLLPFWHGWH